MKPKPIVSGVFCLAMLAVISMSCAPSTPVARQPCPTQLPCPTQEPLECPTAVPQEPVECAPASAASGEAVAAARAVAEAYADAWEQKDVEKFFAVHTEDALIVEVCSDDEFFMDLSKSWYRSTFANQAFKVTVDSFFISDDGRFALLEGMGTDYIKDGEPVMIPTATILEIEDGKIIKRTIYSHGSTC